MNMDDKEIKGRAEAEVNRITELLIDAGISERRIKLLNPVIVNTAWMKAKLDDAREAVKNSQIVIAYDNGGNQKGIRINPLFTGYENLWKSYLTGLDRIMSALPPEKSHEIVEEAEKTEPSTVLSLVRQRKKKEA
jgi:hypothetical protein